MTDQDNSALDSFTRPSTTAEDALKSHTVGLVPLAEFRKRKHDLFDSGKDDRRAEGTDE